MEPNFAEEVLGGRRCFLNLPLVELANRLKLGLTRDNNKVKLVRELVKYLAISEKQSTVLELEQIEL